MHYNTRATSKFLSCEAHNCVMTVPTAAGSITESHCPCIFYVMAAPAARSQRESKPGPNFFVWWLHMRPDPTEKATLSPCHDRTCGRIPGTIAAIHCVTQYRL